ncbi:MAG: sigma 54-dependent Fis family transcriptional regulator [Myxococcales bacterium]|nr:sigma 54-dependent Fis family transcriptional regulator [Myxococcales bacterium]
MLKPMPMDKTERVAQELAGRERVLSVELVVVEGPSRGERAVVPASGARVGSGAGTDLTLADRTVSRLHCEVFVRGDSIVVRDCESTNGVVVDGIRFRDAEVPAGSVVRVGESAFRVEVGDEPMLVPVSERGEFGELLGASLEMRRVYSALERIAPTDSTLLVTGETGTGKDVVARSLHAASRRHAGPFVPVDCGAIPEHLVESELFGHVRGAFSGAVSNRRGVFEEASGGTLFLDEIGEMPVALQPKLLRALETKSVRRVGANTATPIDVRVVAATNRPLAKAVNEGTFREDLFYRLAVFEVRLPPLRARRDDIPLLAARFYEKLGGVGELPQAYVEALQQRAWPGNVRELRNALERAVAFGPTTGTPATQAAASAKRALPAGIEAIVPLHLPLKEAREAWLEAFESIYVRAMLEKTGGNVSRAAELSGVSRRFLQRTLARLGLRAAEADGDDD